MKRLLWVAAAALLVGAVAAWLLLPAPRHLATSQVTIEAPTAAAWYPPTLAGSDDDLLVMAQKATQAEKVELVGAEPRRLRLTAGARSETAARAEAEEAARLFVDTRSDLARAAAATEISANAGERAETAARLDALTTQLGVLAQVPLDTLAEVALGETGRPLTLPPGTIESLAGVELLGTVDLMQAIVEREVMAGQVASLDQDAAVIASAAQGELAFADVESSITTERVGSSRLPITVSLFVAAGVVLSISMWRRKPKNGHFASTTGA